MPISSIACRTRSAFSPSRDAALATGMTDGMEMSYKALDGLLEAA